MREPDFNRKNIGANEEKAICDNLIDLCMTPGPTRCIAKLSENLDPRIGRNKEFPFFRKIREITDRMNEEQKGETENKLILFQDYGNLILLSGFKDKPPLNEIRDIPFVLASHADEITFYKKKNSPQIMPIFNWRPLKTYGLRHPYVDIYGFEGDEEEREFRKIGIGRIRMEEIKKETFFYLEKVSLVDLERDVKEGDMIIQKYPYKPGECDSDEVIRTKALNKHNGDTIIHAKALDDRVGVLAHLYTMRELNRHNIQAKAIFVGDEEGINKDIAWAKLIRPVFRKYCKEENIIIICDGFDGKKLEEFKEQKGNYMNKALIAPYRSNGKGAGCPGLFALFRDCIVTLCDDNGFEAVTTTDYVSRSFDPKIMDDFPLICSVDWSNGPIETLIFENGEEFFNICHVDESVSIEQVINIIGTTFWTIWFLRKKMEES